MSPRRQQTLIILVAFSNVSRVVSGHAPGTATHLLAVVLSVIQGVALWWISRHPGRATAVAVLTDVGIELILPSSWPQMSLTLLCYLAWSRPARVSLGGLAGLVAAQYAVAGWSGHWERAAISTAAALLAWSWGALGQARLKRRESEARRAVLEERALIAREVHDVLAHTVSVMVVQAAAADDVFDLDPDQARHAIRQVEASGRQALAELRWLLRTVRSEDLSEPEAEPGSEPGDSPQPTLADVNQLATTMSDAALQVTVRREGEGYDDVPRTLGLNAYRIVQESLTNTLRHADADHAEVVLRIADGQLHIDITDDGQSGKRPNDAGGGHGLLGMRERATLLGGSLVAGPQPTGGFLVSAQLPLKGSV